MNIQHKARAIAFYLPQYHPVAVNNDFWGPGFTEWTNVAKAKPLYWGHAQPKLTADLGYYDLRVPEVREQQAELARKAGIESFCYWHYWFGGGTRVLERIFNEVVNSQSPDFPFCLGWANESWNGRWHGLEHKVILEQKYLGLDDYTEHFNSLQKAFGDSRYSKIDGKNIFLIYRPEYIPNLAVFTEHWQNLAAQNNLPAFHFLAVTDEPQNLPESISGWMRSGLTREIPQRLFSNKLLNKLRGRPKIYDYKTVVNKRLEAPLREREIPLVVPNWDNTPRSGKNGNVFEGCTPELYQKWLSGAADKLSNLKPSNRIVFVKSWNEWAEGNYLEPDSVHGHAYIEATHNALK